MGHFFATACGLAAATEAVAGLILISKVALGRRLRSAIDLGFACMGALGLVAIIWANVPGAWPPPPEPARFPRVPPVADPELRRLAAALGVSARQSPRAMADEILRRVPAEAWRMTVTQRAAFGMALDAVEEAQRFRVVVRSIPSDANSVAFSDDLIAVLRGHGWVAVNARGFGVRRELTGIVIAVSPSVQSEDEVPVSAKRLIVMLEKAGFTPYGAVLPTIAAGRFELLIGNGPGQPR